MAVTDPIADALTILRNASFAKKEVAELRNSKQLEAILKILKKEGFISNYKSIKDSKQGLLRVSYQLHPRAKDIHTSKVLNKIHDLLVCQLQL